MKCIDSFSPSLPSLVQKYLDGAEELKEFYAYQPSMEGLKGAYANRVKTSQNRALLTEVLTDQAASSKYANQLTRDQIERLKDQEVVTLTTGHQLCIYGGPLFFFYKILSVVKLSQRLAEEGVGAVPVYWMASEDHDFDEINHIFLKDKRLQWDINATGPVGMLDCETMSDLKSAISDVFQDDFRYESLLKELDAIFRDGRTLSEAIRDLVYLVFAEQGVVVIDAEDARLKSLFVKHVMDELENGFSENALQEKTKKLENLDYQAQVGGRDINLFWMKPDYRERIVKTEGGFATADAQHQWKHDEMLHLADSNPENFSPNVILRPLYQEVILPNIAYVGGPGETSYWLQLKGVFDAAEVLMPVVLLRDMFFISNESLEKKRAQLGVGYARLEEKTDSLFTELVRNEGTHEHLVDDRSIEIQKELESLVGDIAAFDAGLEESAKAEQARILKRLQKLKKKVLRSDKRKNEIIEQRLEYVLNHFRPEGEPQERHDNWLNHFSEIRTIPEMLEYCDPLNPALKVIQL